MFYFVIPLTGRTEQVDWDTVSSLLAGTLRSILGQTHKEFRVVICSQDRPDIPELDDERVAFLQGQMDYPSPDRESERADKGEKVQQVLNHAVKEGATIICRMDADDRISSRLVEYVIERPQPLGHLISKGYVWDYRNAWLCPSSKALKAPFHKRCGSCSVFDFRQNPLEVKREDIAGFIRGFGSHARYQEKAKELGLSWAEVDFPAAIYLLDHGAGLAYRYGWTGKAKDTRHRRIKAHRIEPSRDDLKEFAIEHPITPPPRGFLPRLLLRLGF